MALARVLLQLSVLVGVLASPAAAFAPACVLRTRGGGSITMATPLPGFQTTYDTIKPGSGQTVTKGATVTVHATGIVKETGKKFWYVSALDRD